MAFLEMSYRSKALQMEVSLNVILPEKSKNRSAAGAPDGEYKTLYLLHGLSGDHTAWMRRTSIERYASQYGIAVVMPGVARSWYSDTPYGANYFTFAADEVPAVCRSYFRGMSARREDNLVAGLSMGGYGALKVALSRPEHFGGCASLSGSLDITRKGRPCNLDEWRGNFDFGMHSPDELENSENDLFALTRRGHAAERPMPKLYMWCGTEDPLLEVNHRYRDLLGELGVPCRFEESEGDHSWKWWDLHIQDALAYLLGK